LRRANEYIALDDQLNLKGGSTQFGSQKTFKDKKGNLFFGTTRRNPQTGEVQSVLAPIGNAPEKPDGEVSLVSDLGQTAGEKQGTKVSTAEQIAKKKAEIETLKKLEQEELLRKPKAQTKREIAKAEALGKSSAKKAGDAIKQVSGMRQNNITLRKVIDEVRGGANTGPLISALPSFKAASVRLDNLQKQLGLDVVSGVTFGALSKGELDLALSKALPTNLDGPELIQWAEDKIAAQEKVASYLEDQAIFLSKPGNSESDWLELQRSNQEEKQTGTQEGTTATNPQTGQKVIFTNGQWQPAS